MVTRQYAIRKISELIRQLKDVGYASHRAVLFGSVAKGNIHPYSDIDLALWDKKFSGVLHLDYEPIKTLLRNFNEIELHTFHSSETEEKNPFIGKILNHGIPIEINS